MERFERTITIPVKIENDITYCEDGQPLPKLANPSFGELVIHSISLKDVEDQTKYGQENNELVFKEGKELYFEMKPKFIPHDKINDSHLVNFKNKYFIKVQLQEDLYLKGRFQKKQSLSHVNASYPV